MAKYFKPKKDHYILRDLLMPFAFFILLAVFLWIGVQNISATAETEQLRYAEEAVRRAVVQCYAIEGRYPPDIAYLQEQYGLAVDTEKYVIHYQRIGANLLPQIAVFPLEPEGEPQEDIWLD